MKLVEMNVNDYLDLVASDAPAPGGGSASALCGAQGIGLISMVAKLTLGKAKLEAFHPVCRKVAEKADSIASALTGQIDTDTEAYGRIASAFKLPKDTDENKKARRTAIKDATEYATQVPLETMRLAVEGLLTAEELMGSFNTACASDVGCGVLGLHACVQGAHLNVMINAPGLDEEKSASYLAKAKELAEQADALCAKLTEEVKGLL
ncbi:MAG: cyclodeaminase/cyclohydrolase family protein [Firmicutes bacterium]|nr:cyclodeaminase/cyclohydrolase family protein [Bacillota bacterium]